MKELFYAGGILLFAILALCQLLKSDKLKLVAIQAESEGKDHFAVEAMRRGWHARVASVAWTMLAVACIIKLFYKTP